jgi:oligopeptide/dipeptide ABC transporter ATP-binding protein
VPSLGRRGERLAEIEGVVPAPQDRPIGCRFSTRCPVALPRCPTDPPGDTEVAMGHVARCHVVAQELAG